ncbi:Methyltransferase domain-containing protein [Bordetella sputigena]|uniref:methyltransferase domain-containing protein n=1 Tax=Bordetella sputigena TaxID=1416810 RepID=UPI0039EE9C28
MTRIYGEKVALDPSSVKAFFERRGQSVNKEHPLTAVLYQDNNPGLAETRDAYEKQRVLPLLGLTSASRVLDIGCGIGRWADALADRVATYHGIDFSSSLIEVARRRCKQPEFSFQVLPAQDVGPSTLAGAPPFTCTIIAGVLLYLNDEDLSRTLVGAVQCSDASALIYIREPIGVDGRLTLDKFESAELKSTYSAIYRTDEEFQGLFNETLGKAGFRLRLSDTLYPAELNNRADTVQKIFLFDRR